MTATVGSAEVRLPDELALARKPKYLTDSPADSANSSSELYVRMVSEIVLGVFRLVVEAFATKRPMAR